MSHRAFDRLQSPADRISWISLPSSHGYEEAVVGEPQVSKQRRLSSPSPIFGPQSASSDNGAPTSGHPVLLQNLDEGVGLLNTDREEARYSSRYSVANRPPYNEMARVLDSNQIRDTTDHVPGWLPYTLRRPFLTILVLVSLTISIALAILCWYSTKHHGLGKDDGSVSLLVGWRYTPTIIAVLFTQALVMTAEDIKRTETFARMACQESIEARFTLLYIPKVWWKSVLEGFSRKRSGGRKGWMLAFSSLAAGVSILVISTFSSSIFVAKEVLYQDSVHLQRYGPDLNGTIALVPKRDTYFRTISGYLYNASTSIWISDSHVILPFLPKADDTGDAPLRDGLWKAETTVMQLENNCIPMIMTEKITINVSYSYAGQGMCNDGCTTKSKGFKLQTADGCALQMQTAIVTGAPGQAPDEWSSLPDGYISHPVPKYGGMFWTNMSSSYVSWQDLTKQRGENPAIGPNDASTFQRPFIYSMTEECHGRDLLLVTPPWSSSSRPINIPEAEWQKTYWSNFTVKAEVCTPTYYQARLSVTRSVSVRISEVFFDLAEFARLRKPIPQTLINLARLDNLAFREAWPKYMTAPTGKEDARGFEGVSMLLAQHFSFDLDNILKNTSWSVEASRLRSRYFGELVLSSLLETDSPSLEEFRGQVTLTDRRIMVVTEVAITLAVLLLIAAIYLSSMCWNVSSGRRPLHLRIDPATIVGSTSAMSFQSDIANSLRNVSGKSRADIKDVLASQSYMLQASTIVALDPKKPETPYELSSRVSKKDRPWTRLGTTAKPRRNDWRPSMFRKRWLATMLVLLITLATTLIILRKYGKEERLYRTAFVYQVNLGIFNTSFSPNSVIAALVAVAVGLAWDGIDKPMRTLQPYLSMSRSPTVSSRGVSLSYQTSYWIWASIRAALNRHWILCLVTVGTTLAQILVISMAAVFERQTFLHEQTTQELDAFLYSSDLRQTPFSFGQDRTSRPFYLDESTLETTKADWLYTALDEVILRNAPPSWTKDEWVLTPVSTKALPNITVSQKTGSKNEDSKIADLVVSSANVTVTTSALRARLICSPIGVPAAGWLDQAGDVFSNRTNETIHGYILPTVLFADKPYKTPVFSAPRRMGCCTNGTVPGSQSAIAYWSSSSPMTDARPGESVDKNGTKNLKEPTAWSNNFTIKWIVGPTASTIISGADPVPNSVTSDVGFANESLLYFTEEPQMSILDCMPMIEQTNMSITIAKSTNQVLQARILEAPQPATGAWDYPWDITYPQPSSNSCKGNVSYGHLFISQLLTAAHIVRPLTWSSWLAFNHSIEDLTSERFNIRDTDAGLNMDFMSYAAFHLAQKNPTTLLNATTLLAHSETTLQTFFKHFATRGRWTHGGRDKSTVYEDFAPLMAQRINGTLTQRMDILTLNETATWLSLTIIFLLIAILCVLIVALQTVYPGSIMQHHVECLADVLVMVAGSDEFVKAVHENRVENDSSRTKLGWFRDKRGVVRWGVEVVDGDVEWVDGPE